MNRTDLQRAVALINFDWLACAAAGLIVVLSLLPPSRATGMPVSDTTNHILAYAVLTALASMRRETRLGHIFMLAAIAAFGGAIELIQPFFERAAQLADLAANLTGSATGAAAVLALRRVSTIGGP